MNPAPTITPQQIAQYKSISENVNASKSLDPYVLDAWEFDIRAFLGAELYLDMLDAYAASPSLAAPYDDLYNGSEYTVSGRRRNHPGVLAVLIHFAYARYVENANVHGTKSGFKIKTSDWSVEPGEKTIARKIQQARSAAIALQERVKDYLDNHTTDFPQWYGGKQRRRTAMRITAVGGNSKTKKPYDSTCGVRTINECGDDYVDSSYVE